MPWQAENAGMPTFMLCLSCVLSVAYGDIHSLRASCQKQLWLTGMQLSNGEFGGLDSNGYLEHMLVCSHLTALLAPTRACKYEQPHNLSIEVEDAVFLRFCAIGNTILFGPAEDFEEAGQIN